MTNEEKRKEPESLIPATGPKPGPGMHTDFPPVQKNGRKILLNHARFPL